VIDTVGQKVGPLSMVDAYGTPFSVALHVIERYRSTEHWPAISSKITKAIIILPRAY
jgi:hypothetical protein